jgi:hypothetical protein
MSGRPDNTIIGLILKNKIPATTNYRVDKLHEFIPDEIPARKEPAVSAIYIDLAVT